MDLAVHGLLHGHLHGAVVGDVLADMEETLLGIVHHYLEIFSKLKSKREKSRLRRYLYRCVDWVLE